MNLKLTMVIIVVVTVLPRKFWCERSKEVIDGPSYDHVVVETNEALTDEVDKPEAFKKRRQMRVKGDRTKCRVLTNFQLKEEGWDADDGQHKEIGDEEGATPILEAKVGKPPDVAQTDSVAQTWEEKIKFSSPVSSLGVLIFWYL